MIFQPLSILPMMNTTLILRIRGGHYFLARTDRIRSIRSVRKVKNYL
jgi:hypothetical protein